MNRTQRLIEATVGERLASKEGVEAQVHESLNCYNLRLVYLQLVSGYNCSLFNNLYKVYIFWEASVQSKTVQKVRKK